MDRITEMLRKFRPTAIRMVMPEKTDRSRESIRRLTEEEILEEHRANQILDPQEPRKIAFAMQGVREQTTPHRSDLSEISGVEIIRTADGRTYLKTRE